MCHRKQITCAKKLLDSAYEDGISKSTICHAKKSGARRKDTAQHIIVRSMSCSSKNYATKFEEEHAELTSCSVLRNVLTVPLNDDLCLLSSKISLSCSLIGSAGTKFLCL